MSREVANLRSYNNLGRLELEGQALYCFQVTEEEKEPTNFEEAWNNKDINKRQKWQEAIELEFDQMKKNDVWEQEEINELPKDRKGIGTKWVFKIKKNGMYRARLVAKGYNQIAGVDFQHSFAPLTNKLTLQLFLITMLKKGYYCEIADVQTAFLHGHLEEELFFTLPDRYKEYKEKFGKKVDGKYLKLRKSIYGLVQAAKA